MTIMLSNYCHGNKRGSCGSIALVRAFGLSLLRPRLQRVHNTSASMGNALGMLVDPSVFACQVSSYNISYNITGVKLISKLKDSGIQQGEFYRKRRGRNKLGGKSRRVIHTARNPDKYTTDFRRLCGGDKLPGLYSIQYMSIPS